MFEALGNQLYHSLTHTGAYFPWLIGLGLVCFLLERIRPWRRRQRVLRAGVGQDLFFLLFNAHYFGLLFSCMIGCGIYHAFDKGYLPGWLNPFEANLLMDRPWWIALPIAFVVKDFLEYCAHYLLHRYRLLWRFHMLHHSIVELDWIGNYRFHWMELLIYETVMWLPIALLGTSTPVMLAIAVISTAVGNLNHANVNMDWGPLRYVLNSSRMHVWHHDYQIHHRAGQNFGVVFSFWDYLFGTAYFPLDIEEPDRLGFPGMERFPQGLACRIAYPLCPTWLARPADPAPATPTATAEAEPGQPRAS